MYSHEYRFSELHKRISRDYPLDPNCLLVSEEIVKGSKAWDIVQSCFCNTPWSSAFKDSTTFILDKVARESLKGQRFSAKVAVSKTNDKNYVQHRTIRSVAQPNRGRSHTDLDELITSVLRDLNSL
jgi:hypothetical protein